MYAIVRTKSERPTKHSRATMIPPAERNPSVVSLGSSQRAKDQDAYKIRRTKSQASIRDRKGFMVNIGTEYDKCL